MFAKSVEDEKAFHTANKTIMIPLLNIKHTTMCKKKIIITFTENFSSCKDKGLAPKKEGRAQIRIPGLRLRGLASVYVSATDYLYGHGHITWASGC